MPTTALRTEADIVAAAAAFLGFAPTNSVVAYMLHRDTHTSDLVVRSAIRFDVTISAEQATNFPATCNLRPETNHAAVLLAVCDESYEWHAVTVLDALSDALRAAGIPVLRRLMTRDVTTEGQWYDPDTGATGPTYPYTDSLVTAHRVLGGERVSPARSDIQAEFAPLPPAPADRPRRPRRACHRCRSRDRRRTRGTPDQSHATDPRRHRHHRRRRRA